MIISLPSDQNKTDILSMTAGELSELLASEGEKSFRAAQIYSRLHEKKTFSFDGMTELPAALRARLAGRFGVPGLKIVTKQTSADGTVKYLFETDDGNRIEAVLMEYIHGTTLCISTQAGCRMGCAFCASGLNGLARNLNPSEMLMEIFRAEEDSGRRVDGIVMMGTGEPLDNFDASVAFIGLTDIGKRHISLSTSGLCDRIRELQKYSLEITLSISLHAPTDEIRSRLMPVNRKWPVRELVETASAYQSATGRRVSYEYAMIDGVNDSPAEAEALIRLLSGRGSHLNLIRLNRIPESPFAPTPETRLAAFKKKLEAGGLNVTVRRRLGADIDGACGQLRRRNITGGDDI